MKRALALLCLLSMTVGGLLLASGCWSGGHRSLVLVTVAGLRADVLDEQTTPHLVALGRAGEQTDSCVTPVPDTVIALTGLMTGDDPVAAGLHFGDLARVPASATTLAERLRERGYVTAAFIGHGQVGPMTGLGRGFDWFVTPSSPFDKAVLGDEMDRAETGTRSYVPGPSLVERVGAFLLEGRHESRPFFFWVHLADPSVATAMDDPLDRYQEGVSAADEAVGYLADALGSHGLSESTVLAVVSLHGEALGTGGEIRHGLSTDPVVVSAPAVVSGPAGVPDVLPDDGPFPLVSLHQRLMHAVGAGPETSGAPGAVESETWWPERLYGGTPSKQLLATMSKAHAAQRAGKRDLAANLFATASGMAPEALSPRLNRLSLMGREAHETGDRNAARDAIESLAAESRALVGDSTAQRLDVNRTLTGTVLKGQALEDLRNLVEEPLEPGERLAAAAILARGGAIEEARAEVERVAGEEPGAPELQEWLGDLLARSGNTYRARLAYEKAIEASVEPDANLVAKLGDALASLGENEAALGKYAEAVQRDPGYRYPHAKAAQIFLEQGDTARAAHALVMSIQSSGKKVEDAVRRAHRLADAGLFAAAAAEIDKALEDFPAHDRLLSVLARVYAQSGRPDKARELVSTVLEANPDSGNALVELARLEAEAGNFEQAAKALKKAEAVAWPRLAMAVRSEPLFRGAGENSRLARVAEEFTPSQVRRDPDEPVGSGKE